MIDVIIVSYLAGLFTATIIAVLIIESAGGVYHDEDE